MLTLLINESNPLDGLFANSTTGGVGTVPDITVADDGQAVSVQSFTRAGGIITDSFVAGDVLHIGIGDGVNAPVCYVALSSASPAVGTMPINTAGMVALFAATVANQISLTLAVVRTRGAYTNTIFSAPIVIRRSAINISTAVPTPSILGTGVAAALQIAINTALGFVRLDASARLPAVDGSQLTNLPNTGGVTAITGTANEITVTGTTTPTLSLPSALTFTGKTVTGGTFNSGAFNGSLGTTTPSTVAGTTITGTSSATLGTNGGTGGSVILNGSASGSATINVSAAGALQFGEFTAVAATLSAALTTTGEYAMITTVGTGSSIFTSGNDAAISTSGNDAGIFTVGPSSHIQTGHSSSYIQTASTFKLNGGTFVTTLSHGATANRAIAFPDAAGTLLLADGSGASLTALNASNISSGTLADARLSANVPLKDAANTFTAENINSKSGAASVTAMKFTGVPFAGTGTTSFPLVYINDANATASTTLNTAGTYLGVNGDGTQDLMNLLKDGVSQFKVGSTGIVNTYRVTATSAISTTNDGFSTSGNGTGTWFGRTITVNGHEMGVNANVGILFTTPYINATGTLAVTGATTLTGNLTSNGALISTPQALTGAGAVNVTTLTTAVTTTAPAQALTLANGTNGQIKTIVHQALSGGGTWVLTPTTKTGYTTITSTAVGETCTLQFFTTIGWCILSLRGAIAA